MSATPLFSQLRRLEWLWRPLAAWCGGVAYPVTLWLAVLSGPPNSTSLRFFLCAVATVLPVALLRRHPLPGSALMLVGTFAVSAQRPSWEVVYLLVLVNDLNVLAVVASRARRVAFAVAVPTLLVHIASATFFTSGMDVYVRTLVVLVLALVAAWMIGLSVAERREHAVEQRAQVAAQAVAAERLRIARELHDMIAHSVGVIAIQAGVGSRVIGTQPDEARKALLSIEATSRRLSSACGGRSGPCAVRGRFPARSPYRSIPHRDSRTSNGWRRRRRRARVSGWSCGGVACGGRFRRTSTSPRTASCRRRSPMSYGTRGPRRAGWVSSTGARRCASRSWTTGAGARAPTSTGPGAGDWWGCGSGSVCWTAG